ncbi:leucine-rich repeat domain-containing protein [Myroides odoratus]|uniref:Leucine Rich repeats (2 copies) n=1 Tax=Myroides odoratus TaxID=256 RepID=A0A378RJ09_MYROD|nr:leucine-rich repeat domain-containing protein [Myroides odoratus]QQU02130.1 leucine-rich repeat domain-containing protein [Myroides odoratus]STZ26964.1 Leucine Rich repeats (2 copies) [Myroides odoratus]
MQNIVITSSELIQIELNNLDIGSDFIDNILESKFFEYNYISEQISLYDIDQSQIVLDNTTINQINSLLKNTNLESLKINNLYPHHFLPWKINSVDTLTLHGNIINTCATDLKHKLNILANEVKNTLPYFAFIETTKERLSLEKEVNDLYQEILKVKVDFITDEIIDFIIEKKVKHLELGWFALSENDYKKIETLNIETLSILYSFNTQIKILPKSIKDLSILGNAIQSLNDIKFKKLKLSNLDLSNNSIQDDITLNNLYNKIENLSLNNNLITRIDFSKTSKYLELVDLSNNIITNDGVIVPAPCNHLNYLDLSNNKLKINLDFLFKIDHYFPNLEYIDLSGNVFLDAFGKTVLAPMAQENQIGVIKDYLDIIEFIQDISFEDLKNSIQRYNETHYIKLVWDTRNSNSELLIKEIHFYLKNYLKFLTDKEKFFFAEGIYINLFNKNVSILINSDNNSISLEIFSDNQSCINDYFYKYLELLHDIIFDITHQYILPVIQTTENLKQVDNYFRKVFKIDTKLSKSSGYLIKFDPQLNNYALLLSHNVDYKDFRSDIDKVMFIIISSKTTIAYTLNEDNKVSNYMIRSSKKKLNSVTIRTSEDKENYKKALLNPYLGEIFKETDAYLGGDIKKKFTLIINTNFFNLKQENQTDNLYLNSDKYIVDPNNSITEHSKVVILLNQLVFEPKK